MKKLSLLATALLAAPAFATTFGTPQNWATTIQSTDNYAGASGTITFNDWGYKGPTVGGYTVGANDFQVGSGFDASRIGQIQHVVTTGPDGLTPDAARTIKGDSTTSPTFTNASMDSQVNFYKWGYTTVAGSTFNNMQIDKAGNYHIAKNDMSFQFYDTFQYHDTTGANPDSTYDTNYNFKPYAISDAKGWCGSVLTSDPSALAFMAGQVTFDFAFNVYGGDGGPFPGGNGSTLYDTQIVPGFVMRSYGDYAVNVKAPNGFNQIYTGSAVMNNTNPLTGQLDSAYQNKVSFLGAGVIPEIVYILDHGTNPDGTRNIEIVSQDTPGAVLHYNTFGGYAFLLRADGSRILDYVNPTGFSDYVAAVPEPETYAMMFAGLALVGGAAARKRGASRA